MLIREKVNIYHQAKPLTLERPSDRRITVGDLHGNAMKLIFVLLKHGVLLGLKDDLFKKMKFIYQLQLNDKVPRRYRLTKDALHDFVNHLNTCHVNRNIKLRFLGDELSDRGQNDFFTLAIFEFLHKNEVDFEIILSNHALEFIHALGSKKDFSTTLFIKGIFRQSLDNLQACINHQWINKKAIVDMAKNSYFPHIKMIGIDYDIKQKELSIHTHAPIGMAHISKLAEQLGCVYNLDTFDKWLKSVNDINQRIQALLAKGTLHDLYSEQALDPLIRHEYDNSDISPFLFMLWNRNYELIEQRLTLHDYTLTFIHGHDSKAHNLENLISLDTLLGKKLYGQAGWYKAFYQTITPSLCPWEKALSISFFKASEDFHPSASSNCDSSRVTL